MSSEIDKDLLDTEQNRNRVIGCKLSNKEFGELEQLQLDLNVKSLSSLIRIMIKFFIKSYNKNKLK